MRVDVSVVSRELDAVRTHSLSELGTFMLSGRT